MLHRGTVENLREGERERNKKDKWFASTWAVHVFLLNVIFQLTADFMSTSGDNGLIDVGLLFHHSIT